jgi:hypothetical protein
MTENFTITVASDDEHESVYAEIYCQGKFVALVSQEGGPEQMRIEFPHGDLNEAMIARSVAVEDFRQALTAAVERLSGNKS